jgi:hypothetical protein
VSLNIHTDVDVVKLLPGTASMEVNSTDNLGYRVLFFASRFRHHTVVQVLFDYGLID